jgi:hypothetical protein
MDSTISMPPALLSSVLVAAIPLLALGCDVDEQTSMITQEQVSSDPTCADCGTNGNVLEGSAVGHLGRGGQVNSWGVTLIEFWHPLHLGVNLRVGVHFDRLYGIDDTQDTIVLQGIDLERGVFEILTALGDVYEVRILKVNRDWQYWTNPAMWIESYELSYDGPYSTPHTHPTTAFNPQPLCPQLEGPGLFGHKMDAAVFEGEIYHQEDLSFENTASGEHGWFNIACAHSATLKQLFTRRTPRARPFGSGIVDEAPRKASLRAWTGDYCGTGESFTTTGVPLLVRDRAGTIPTNHEASWSDTEAEANEITYEAVWDEHGAVCINDWRRRQYVKENRKVHDESAVAAAQDRCSKVGHALPPCQTLIPMFPTGWSAFGNILTAFPTKNLTMPPLTHLTR